MTDTAEEHDETAEGDYEYDEAHGADDTGPDVPQALRDEAERHLSLSPPT